MIQFERETWGDLEAALRREWLETNGLPVVLPRRQSLV